MSPFLLHPPECQKIIDSLLGEKALRSVDSGVEGEEINGEEGLFVTGSLSLSSLPRNKYDVNSNKG